MGKYIRLSSEFGFHTSHLMLWENHGGLYVIFLVNQEPIQLHKIESQAFGNWLELTAKPITLATMRTALISLSYKIGFNAAALVSWSFSDGYHLVFSQAEITLRGEDATSFKRWLSFRSDAAPATYQHTLIVEAGAR